MSMRGGYQIINLEGKPLYSGKDGVNGENHIKIPRIYYNLFNSNAKMILLSGLSLDSKGYRDYEIIPYECEMDGNKGFQAILRRNWNTSESVVTTYYLNIADDDDVFVTYNDIKYEDVEQALDEDSTKAIANGVVTREFKKYLPLAGGKMSGTLSMGGNRITNLSAPTAENDAARKAYVDTLRSDLTKFVQQEDTNLYNTISAEIQTDLRSASTDVVAKTINNVIINSGTVRMFADRIGYIDVNLTNTATIAEVTIETDFNIFTGSPTLYTNVINVWVSPPGSDTPQYQIYGGECTTNETTNRITIPFNAGGTRGLPAGNNWIVRFWFYRI